MYITIDWPTFTYLFHNNSDKHCTPSSRRCRSGVFCGRGWHVMDGSDKYAASAKRVLLRTADTGILLWPCCMITMMCRERLPHRFAARLLTRNQYRTAPSKYECRRIRCPDGYNNSGSEWSQTSTDLTLLSDTARSGFYSTHQQTPVRNSAELPQLTTLPPSTRSLPCLFPRRSAGHVTSTSALLLATVP